MSITVFIKNTKPCWVEYGFEVTLADDSLTDERARELALEHVEDGREDTDAIRVLRVSDPKVRGTIESMDQEFDVTEIFR
jgi:hypothetical protein